MNIYINKKERDSILNAWEEVNVKLECCSEEESVLDLNETLKGLSSIIRKLK